MLWIRKQVPNAAYIMRWIVKDRHQNVLGKITKCREARRGTLCHSPLLSSRTRIVGSFGITCLFGQNAILAKCFLLRGPSA